MFVGKQFGEKELFNIGYAYEQQSKIENYLVYKRLYENNWNPPKYVGGFQLKSNNMKRKKDSSQLVRKIVYRSS